jgi:hypothetical protein
MANSWDGLSCAIVGLDFSVCVSECSGLFGSGYDLLVNGDVDFVDMVLVQVTQCF